MGNGPEIFHGLIVIERWLELGKDRLLWFVRPKSQLVDLGRHGNNVAALRASWQEAKDVSDGKPVDSSSSDVDAEVARSLLDLRSRIDAIADQDPALEVEVEGVSAIFDELDSLRAWLKMEPSVRPREK